ncbi:MAG: GNAT family N-acetyltransferase [Chloroflexota bacterium]
MRELHRESQVVRPVTRSGASTAGLTIRPAKPEELAGCASIWRSAINDYIRPLGQPEIPPEGNPVTRLFVHLQSTDPDRFVVATVPGIEGNAGGEVDGRDVGSLRIVAFASAVVRERLWYLSMLFVLPEFQGAGLGRELLAQLLPTDGTLHRATATDSAQPISNALYATHGMVPRMPLLSLTGLPRDPGAFGALPSGVEPLPFDELAAGPPDGLGHRMLVDAIDSLDRELLGAAHPHDHRFLRTESRQGWLYRGPDGMPVGYGYAGEAGRVGPVAVLDEALLAPIIGHLTSAVVPRGAFAIWVGGAAHRALVPALRAGFRLDQFPVLLCWDRPFADFSRYLPISPGLL